MTSIRDVIEDRWTVLEAIAPPAGRALVTASVPVDTPDGPLQLGIDADGGRHLLIPLNGRHTVEPDETGRAVRLRVRPLEDDISFRRYADLALIENALSEVFTSLCCDVLVAVGEAPDKAVRALRRVLRSWRALLAGASEPLSPQALAGLYGELLVLRDLLQHDAGIVNCWHGPSGAAQDFHLGDNAIEVKSTTASEGRMVRVHGVDQLQTPAGGTLTLVWFRLARGTPMGTSVPSLIDEVIELVDDPALVQRGLGELGYREVDRTGYADIRFELREEIAMDVTLGFPRIVRDSLSGDGLLAGISDLTYTVDLDAAPARAARIDNHVRRFLGTV